MQKFWSVLIFFTLLFGSGSIVYNRQHPNPSNNVTSQDTVKKQDFVPPPTDSTPPPYAEDPLKPRP